MTLRRLIEAGLVPVVRAKDVQQAVELSRALVEGGVRALEVTMTVPDAPRAIALLRDEFGEQVLVGAGTVTDRHTLAECLAAGAEFVVTPVCLPELVAPCHQHEILVALGAATPSEIWHAHCSGADLVKVFPVSAFGGPSYLAALRGPFPNIPLMPTGGVTLANLDAYVAAGAKVLGIGSALANTQLLKERGPAAVSSLARDYFARFRSITSNCPDSA